MRRTAPEEWNLAANYQHGDEASLEFVRTYMSIDFKGGVLLRRLEQEKTTRLDDWTTGRGLDDWTSLDEPGRLDDITS